MRKVYISLLMVMLATSFTFAASKTVQQEHTLHSTRDVTITLDDLGKGILQDVPSDIEIEGKTYHATAVDTKIAKEYARVEEKRTFTDTSQSELPKTVKKDGIQLKLENDSIEEAVIVRDAVTGSHTWTGCSSEPDIPESLELTTDSGLTVTGYLQDVESHRSDTLAEYEFPATFIGDADCQYYEINGKRIPNTFTAPTFEGYEEEILAYLNLSDDDYDITGGSWTSDYVQENGQTVRHAIFICSADVLTDYTAYYEENLTEASPGYSTTDITAVYSNGIEDTEYDITVVVEYEKDNLTTKQIILFTGAALLIMAGLISCILMLIRRKKKEPKENMKEEKTHGKTT